MSFLKDFLVKWIFLTAVAVTAILCHEARAEKECLPRPFVYETKVIRIIDGDTVVGMFDLGFGINLTRKIRLLNIDSPERHGASRNAGDAAKHHLAKLIRDGQVLVVTQNREDSFGRVLGELYKDGVNLNQQMIEDGHAKKYERRRR